MVDEAVSETAFDTSRLMVDFNQMKAFGQDPLILASGEGIRVTDVFGKTYIDGLSGVFTANLGHGLDFIADVAADQMRRIAFTAPTMATNPPALQLADLLLRITPEQYTTVKFFSGGSEATEAAIRMARQYFLNTGTGGQLKFKTISRYLAYHGGTGFAGAASGQSSWKWRAEPYPTGFVHVTPPARPGCAACKRRDACDLACLDLIEEAIVREQPETVAAVIAEPIMLSAGVQVPHPEYFPRLREICDRHDVLLIYDEIITGFGRTGKLFGAEVVGAWPDILCVAKGISGGYAPLSAILVTDRVGKVFWGEADAGVQFWAGHTYGGNPVACAVGEAAVRYLLEHDLVGNAERVGSHLANRLREIGTRYPVVSEIRGVGMLRGMAFYEPIGHAVFAAARRRGLLVRPGADFIGVAPPLVTTVDEADEIAAIVEAALKDVAS